MTDREKLMELFAQRCEWGKKICIGCKDALPVSAECKEIMFGETVDHLIANGVTVKEWISVEDRLPEKDVDVLVCDRQNNVFVAAVCASDYFSQGLSWRDKTGYLIGNLGIVSWQPLPKPTKEETKQTPSYTPPPSQANTVDPSSPDFGAVLNCAVRYCIGRRTYMPSLVISFIKPLIPQIETRTLVVMGTDIQEAYSLGDECDEKVWEAFREQIECEIDKRRERV